MTRLLTNFIFLCFFCAPSLAASDANAPKAFIEGMGRRGIEILANPAQTRAEREAAFHEILSQFFAVEAIAKFVLGQYWRQLDDTTKDRYLQLFENEIVRSYAVRFENYHGEKFHVTGSRQEEHGGWVVSSSIERPGGQVVNVNWIVHETPLGLRVFDVKVEGVSMSSTKRSEYAAIISRQGGVQGLLKALSAQYP